MTRRTRAGLKARAVLTGWLSSGASRTRAGLERRALAYWRWSGSDGERDDPSGTGEGIIGGTRSTWRGSRFISISILFYLPINHLMA